MPPRTMVEAPTADLLDPAPITTLPALPVSLSPEAIKTSPDSVDIVSPVFMRMLPVEVDRDSSEPP